MNLTPLQKWFAVYAGKIAIVYFALIKTFDLLVSMNVFDLLAKIEAQIIYFIAKIFLPQIQLNGNILSNIPIYGGNDLAVSIDNACLGIIPIIGFASMILALPIKKEKMAKCLLFGIPIIFIANIARILMTIGAGALWGGKAFDFFHNTVAKFDLMLTVIILFLACVRFFVGKLNFKEID